MPQVINWELVRHPLNWLTVFLMCAFALIALTLIFPESAPFTPTED